MSGKCGVKFGGIECGQDSTRYFQGRLVVDAEGTPNGMWICDDHTRDFNKMIVEREAEEVVIRTGDRFTRRKFERDLVKK